MEIINTHYGKVVIIPETENNCEFRYELRNVRKINDNCKDEQDLINELESKEQKAERKFLLLSWSMENAFKRLGRWYDYHTWEEHNKAEFNEYYHDQLQLLEDEVNSYSFEYAARSTHGYCV